MAFHALQEILDKDMPFWRAVLLEDMQDRSQTEDGSMAAMEKLWEAMVAASESYDGSLHSPSGLVGGMGRQMEEYRKTQKPLCGDFMAGVITQALEMGESNACMKRIVAAPTAGACGVLPAVLLPLYRSGELTQDRVLPALYTAAGIGQVIASRAFIAGAAGGCQAEIGTASAMAAGALVQIKGGTGEQIAHAAGMALKNLLGLVCDPVAGLVEVPCVKRNVIGAVNALSCADMALAGITSRIPPDQVIDAMAEIGRSMHVSLRETGEGGVANTPAAREIREKLGM
jgi:L-serine dehydratase